MISELKQPVRVVGPDWELAILYSILGLLLGLPLGMGAILEVIPMGTIVPCLFFLIPIFYVGLTKLSLWREWRSNVRYYEDFMKHSHVITHRDYRSFDADIVAHRVDSDLRIRFHNWDEEVMFLLERGK